MTNSILLISGRVIRHRKWHILPYDDELSSSSLIVGRKRSYRLITFKQDWEIKHKGGEKVKNAKKKYDKWLKLADEQYNLRQKQLEITKKLNEVRKKMQKSIEK